MARDREDTQRQMNAGLVAAAVVAVLLAIFIFQNTQEVPVQLYFWEFEGQLWIVLLATAVVTLVMAELVTVVRRARRRR